MGVNEIVDLACHHLMLVDDPGEARINTDWLCRALQNRLAEVLDTPALEMAS